MLQSLHNLIATDALAKSSAVFVYDTTPTAPFGEGLVKLANSAEVWQMQTRPGAGTALVGFVESIAFTSKGAEVNETEELEKETVQVPAKRASRPSGAAAKKAKTTVGANSNADKAVTVLSSSAAFLSLVPSLLSLPASDVRPSLAIHVSTQTSSLDTDEEGKVSLIQVPDLASLFEGVQTLDEAGWNGAVVMSETAQDAAVVGTGIAQALTGAGYDLVNVFDGVTAGRQVANLDASATVDAAGHSLTAILESALPFFTYTGSSSATEVIVVPASTYSSSAKAALAAIDAAGSSVGILAVRVVKPWNPAAFLTALPASAKTIHIFAEQDSSVNPFHADILASLLAPRGLKLKVRVFSIPTLAPPTVAEWANTIVGLTSSTATPALKSLLPEASKLATFWDLDSTTGQTDLVPSNLARAFASSSTGVEAKIETRYDNFRQGGLQQSLLLLESADKATNEYTLSALAATIPPSLLFLSSPAAVFKAYEPISASTVGPSTRIVIAANWTAEDLATKLPASARKALVAAYAGTKGNLFVVDVDALASTHSLLASQVAEIVFWSLYLPTSISAKEIVALLAGNPSFATLDHSKLVEVNSAVRNAIVQVEVATAWGVEAMPVDGAVSEVAPSLPTTLASTAAGRNPDRYFVDPVPQLLGGAKNSWHHVAQRLLFPEAFGVTTVVEEKMRPDLPEKNFMVTVSENRRLTPKSYDRNVFHLEFSTAGTGLKYSVGEALGIHGWNDEEDTRDFLAWYGLDPEAIITAPARDDPTRVEQRTIFQTFQQTLDIFGKPGKSFYETLSKYATNKDEERALRFIACADGHATFKKMSEVDMVTYADLMRQFPSAHPSVEELVREIEHTHPRHYSIASSQNFVGDSVHLLVVTVEWNDAQGRPRYGQCTRYLNNLKVGQQVMVSVKPSVMKLPPIDSAPIIMAGLGTGAAPFRAFIQERAWQKEQGMAVGPSLYYFGSRHRSMEYLYGEEIEAYMHEGVISHTGLAFSRDTDKKIYIQHKMNEDATLLAKMMETGTFFLCGPTWPVPDVYEALVNSFVGQGKTIEAAQAYIEELKEQERYVLEVY